MLSMAYHVAGEYKRDLELTYVEVPADGWSNYRKFRALVALGQIDEALRLLDDLFSAGAKAQLSEASSV